MNFSCKRNELRIDEFRETPFSIKNENCDLVIKDFFKKHNFFDINKYPDIFYIRKKLSNYLNISFDQLVFGHGSDDVLKNLFLCLDYNSVQILEHSYKMAFFYNNLLNKNIYTNSFEYRDGFYLKNDIIKLGGDILYIVNPHCPTTFSLNENDILKFSNHFKYVIIDEAYTDPLYINKKYLTKKNIIIVKSFSKLGAAGGLRIGYCVTSNKEIVESICSITSNYNLNSEAIRYLEILINSPDLIKSTQLEFKKAYEYLIKKLNVKTKSFFVSNFALFEYNEKLKDIGVEYNINFKKFNRITLTNDFVFKKII